jgi:hypothetical protein
MPVCLLNKMGTGKNGTIPKSGFLCLICLISKKWNTEYTLKACSKCSNFVRDAGTPMPIDCPKLSHFRF